MTVMILVCAAILFLSFANGANDNFKGVATLYGSGQMAFRPALYWATAATLAGSLAALFLAKKLAATFSGKGLVPDAVMVHPAFALAVGLGAALTIFAASRTGMPVSTTHALVGALCGAGWALAPAGIHPAALLHSFLLPLILSPGIALLAAGALYPVLSRIRKRSGIEEQTCVCVGETIVPQADGSALQTVRMSAGDATVCRREYAGTVCGVDVRPIAYGIHALLGGAVSFARGLNDAPKILGVLMLASALPRAAGLVLIAVAMAVGALVYARRVAETMSHRITDMNLGQGMTAAATTAALVLFASSWGAPVSTTHVSCGALFGIGAVTGRARWRMIATIVSAWVTTLPMAAACAALAALAARNV